MKIHHQSLQHIMLEGEPLSSSSTQSLHMVLEPAQPSLPHAVFLVHTQQLHREIGTVEPTVSAALSSSILT